MMFLVEDLPAIALGVAASFYLTDRPQDAGWLEPQERDWLAATMAVADEDTAARHGWSIRRSLTSGRVLALAFQYFGVVYGLNALSFFLPSIVAGFSEQFQTDFTLLQTGLIVAVPFVVGAVAMVLWGLARTAWGSGCGTPPPPPCSAVWPSPSRSTSPRRSRSWRRSRCARSASSPRCRSSGPCRAPSSAGRGGGGHRARQLAGQPCRLRRPLRHGVGARRHLQHPARVVARRHPHVRGRRRRRGPGPRTPGGRQGRATMTRALGNYCWCRFVRQGSGSLKAASAR